MIDVTDPALLSAYEDIRSDKTETNWAVFGYDSSGKKIQLEATGSGSIAELAKRLKDDAVQYGYIAIVNGDSGSVRKQFIFISWGGPSASVMKKAKISVHKADIQKIIKVFSVEIHGIERSDFDEEAINATLRKAKASDYSTSDR